MQKYKKYFKCYHLIGKGELKNVFQFLRRIIIAKVSPQSTENRLHYYSYDSINNPWLAGGGSLRDVEVLQHMLQKFQEIHLFVGSFPNASSKKIKGINIHYLGFGNNEFTSRFSYFIIANLHILWNSRKASNIGITISPYSPLFSILFFKKKSYGIIHHIIGKKHWKNKIKIGSSFCGWIEQAYLSTFKNVITVNQFVYRFIRKTNKMNSIFQSANGYEPSYLKVNKISTKPPFLLYIGRLDIYMKGLDLLIDAFSQISSPKKLSLIIAGRTSGNNLQLLQQQIAQKHLSSRIVIQTNITEKEKKLLLATCLFFISPSRYEGWGIAALEANATGNAVIVSQAHGFQNSIADGYSGILVDIYKKNHLLQAINKLLKDRDTLEKLRVQAKQWAKQFSWKNIAKKESLWIRSWSK